MDSSESDSDYAPHVHASSQSTQTAGEGSAASQSSQSTTTAHSGSGQGDLLEGEIRRELVGIERGPNLNDQELNEAVLEVLNDGEAYSSVDDYPDFAHVDPDEINMQLNRLLELARRRFGAVDRADAQVNQNEERASPLEDVGGAQGAAVVDPQERVDYREAGNRRMREHRQRRNLAIPRMGFSYDPDFDYAALPAIDIGPLSRTCSFCSALCFRGESNGLCCSSGKVRLDRVEPQPEPYLSLFSGDRAESIAFLDKTRVYNECFAMTSFGAKLAMLPGVPYTFRIQGQIHHRMGSILPVAGESPRFLQVYFACDDPNEQIDRRCENSRVPVRRNIVSLYQELFDTHNILLRQFKTALELSPPDANRFVIRALDRAPQGEHPGRFNTPSVSEVAMILVEGENQRRDIIIHRRSDSSPMRIYEMHPSYDALQYPLIFWKGNDTYNYLTMKQADPETGNATNRKLTTLQFYCYHLMLRDTEDKNFLLKCGSLLSQFIVDMYVKIEAERLRYLRLNQDRLRADLYIHLRDALQNDLDPESIGRRVILPSIYIGSPRHMAEYTQDAMAYVRIYGRPDLFITFTCNGSWPEIKNLLMRGQKALHRHDITARVFRQKLLKLMDVIQKQDLFGPVRCYMYTIEWQKRGLPHAHLLFWLTERMRPEQIDNIISAEIPDPEDDPILFSIISKQMIHRPCGPGMNSMCWDAQRRLCTKRFPRAFLNATITAEDGYPLYRRRSPEHGGQQIVVEGRPNINNQWVVPHNRVLCRMFNAHINVEYCNSVKSIKYVCKYINKGSDMATFGLEPEVYQRHENDEISLYNIGRYVSSNEAAWRLFSFPIHDRFPPVFHLDVHLEGEQTVYFNAQNAANRAEHERPTKLTAFFQLCRTDSFARTLLYSQVPEYYTFNESARVWNKRVRGDRVQGTDTRRQNVIGRVYTVHPRAGDKFYLRLLLTKRRGPTSFEYLRTVNGQVLPTFQDACRELGFLEDDRHFDAALQEASASRMPNQIRSLFALIVSSGEPVDPKRLWERYKNYLSEDIRNNMRRLNPNENIDFNTMIYNTALIMIEDLCIRMVGKNLAQLGMIRPNREFGAQQASDHDLIRETSYDREALLRFTTFNGPRLTPEQVTIFQTIIDSIRHERGGFYFIDAPGGTGKTFLTNMILAQVRINQRIILATASSGIAATLLDGGKTAHSAFNLPIDTSRAPSCTLTSQSGKGRLLQQCSAIIWDECTMAHKNSLECLNMTLKDLRRNQLPFGGVTMILSGDFRQTLPVIPRSHPAQVTAACLKNSYLWSSVVSLNLRENMRATLTGDSTAREFANRLLTLGDGRVPISSGMDEIRLPSNFCNLVPTVDVLIDRIFADVNTNASDLDYLSQRAILAPKNDAVDAMNKLIQNRLDGRSRFYYSIDRTCDETDAVHFPIEVLNSFSVGGLPPHELELKKGSPIILLRNLDPPKLCNGTRLCVRALHNNLIEATILSARFRGENVFIPRIPLRTQTDLLIEFKRIQFPVRLAFAMTINKSQGQSLKTVGLQLAEPCFSHGQLYVACSRVGSPNHLYVHAPDGKTRNVVYPIVLSRR